MMTYLRTLVFAAVALALGATAATAQSKATAATGPAAKHKVAIQVNENNPATMNLALNNAMNIINYYKKKGETVDVAVVTFGPGLHMFRKDTSPVKQRVAQMSLENSNLSFHACANTQENMQKAEGKPVVLISEAKMTPSGVIRLMELQQQGYAYLRP